MIVDRAALRAATAMKTKDIIIPDVPSPKDLGEGATDAEKQATYSAYRARWWELNVRPFNQNPSKGRPR